MATALILLVLFFMPLLIPFMVVRFTTTENDKQRSENKIGESVSIIRLLIVVICFVLSGPGWISLLFLAFLAVAEPTILGCISILTFFAAFSFLIVMSFSWVGNFQLPKIWPVVGTIAGISSFMIFPLGVSVSTPKVMGSGLDLFAITLGGEIMALGPCLLLASYLVWFHLKSLEVTQSPKWRS